MKPKVLITGGYGFIASAIVRKYHETWDITILDSINYAADERRVKGCLYKFIKADIALPIEGDLNYDYILHLAAETHVDRSIKDPLPFVLANVLGTYNMLEFARRQKKLKKFLYFSTDEVFGSAPTGTKFIEGARYNASNPYSATKAGGEELCVSYANTYKLPVMITHCMNAMGIMQNSEKFIPKVIRSILNGEELIIHTSPNLRTLGSRYYVPVTVVADAVGFLLTRGNELKYNIVGNQEVNNLELAKLIAEFMGRDLKYTLGDPKERPGHDLRYALDGRKMRELGFRDESVFDEELKGIVNWYMGNQEWLV